MELGMLPESDAGLRLQHAAKLLLEQAAAEARLAREQPWAAPLGHSPERPQAVADAVNHVLVYAREGVRRGGHGRRRRHLLAAAVRVLLSTAPAASARALQAEAALPLLLRLVAAQLEIADNLDKSRLATRRLEEVEHHFFDRRGGVEVDAFEPLERLKLDVDLSRQMRDGQADGQHNEKSFEHLSPFRC